MNKVQRALFVTAVSCFVFVILIGVVCWIAHGPDPIKKDISVSPEEFNRLIGQMEASGLHPRDIEGSVEGSPEERYLTEMALKGY